MIRESLRKKSESEGQELNELMDKLLHYCLFLTKNKWDGEDLCQESICRALKHYPDQEKWNPPLLKKMAYHAWVDKVRKVNKEMLGDVPDQSEGENPVSDRDVFEMLLKTLTPKQLITLVLKEAFQYKIHEVADLLGMTETSVKALLKRTRARLEKRSDGEESRSTVEYWEEYSQEAVMTLLQKSILTQDPSRLIDQLPDLISGQYAPKMLSFPTVTRSVSSPSSVLSMAA
ncbi:sigma factor-like helix-turn-helix DNA-binding protein [Rossellomorea oryzaecorticis]|uniref:Sigma factor-like helix-turn-helix DNA-binding protein n=1 Tax=Rossellomorea oryzaecorticis TaxID=1396505 RepID=A0ABU9KBF7_9BACI